MSNTTKVSKNAECRDLRELQTETNNIYLSTVIISKRSNQLAANLKEELQNRLEEFTQENDNLEEIHENREQIEISSQYERMQKPTLLATDEFIEGRVYWRLPENTAEEPVIES